jgi:L-2,4-diaminobutyrate decarboxylase
MSFLSEAVDLIDELVAYEDESTAGAVSVVGLSPMSALVEKLSLREHVERGGLEGAQLKEFFHTYLQATARLHHPGSLAHQVAVPHHSGALAALLGGFTNNPMAIFEMGPAAATIEYFVVNWLLEKVGWTTAPYCRDVDSTNVHGGGVFTHGGSLANLTALVAARTHLLPDVWQTGSPSDLALLASPESHYSVSRAAGILGIGQRNIYDLELGPDGCILPDRVLPVLARVAADGKRVLALVASACTTALGHFDPLRAVGEICRGRGIWFHVDGAHGAAALLSPRHRKLLDGIELADSITWDAHKLMRTPGPCTALLVRDERTLDGAFEQQASYLFHEKEQVGIDLVHRTVECTKAGLGLRLFFVLATLGEQGLARYIEERFAFTRQAHDFLSALPDFECAAEPQSNILCFRYRDSDAFQLKVRDQLLAEGSFHLSTATFGPKRFLRAVFTTPHTKMCHIEHLVDRIRAFRATAEKPSADY